MKQVEDDFLDRLPLEWDERHVGIDVTDWQVIGSQHNELAFVRNCLINLSRSDLIRSLRSVLNETFGWQMEGTGFAYDIDEYFEEEFEAPPDSVTLFVPSYLKGEPEDLRVFVSRDAWRKLMIRVADIFLQHPSESAPELDAQIRELVEQLRSS